MIIDAHQHFWKYEAERHGWISEEMRAIRRDFLPDDLAVVYTKNGVQGCVAVQVDQHEGENDFLLSCARAHSFIKGIVGWVDIRSSSIQRRLEYYSQHGIIKGFRHIVQAEPDDQFLLKEDFCRGISFLHPYGFTYDILVYAHQLAQVEPFVKKFPNQPFIIDHLAKPPVREHSIDSWRKHIRQLAKHEQVVCKLSGLVTEANWSNWSYPDFEPYLNEVLESFGTSRLIYGSDWPVCLVAASYEQQLGVVEKLIAPLSSAEKEKILGENAIRFYHL